MQQSNATVQCNSPMQQSNATVQCNSPMQLSNATVQCNSPMQQSNATVQCNSPMQLSNATVQCNSPMQLSNATVQCNTAFECQYKWYIYQLLALKHEGTKKRREIHTEMAIEKVTANCHSDDIKKDLAEIWWGRLGWTCLANGGASWPRNWTSGLRKGLWVYWVYQVVKEVCSMELAVLWDLSALSCMAGNTGLWHDTIS
jgi:hypothetical protein